MFCKNSFPVTPICEFLSACVCIHKLYWTWHICGITWDLFIVGYKRLSLSKLELSKWTVFHVFVPQSSSNLACFVQFEKVDIYTSTNYKQKYRAPTNFCFILKVNSTNGLIRWRNYGTHLCNVSESVLHVLFYGLLNRSFRTHETFTTCITLNNKIPENQRFLTSKGLTWTQRKGMSSVLCLEFSNGSGFHNPY